MQNSQDEAQKVSTQNEIAATDAAAADVSADSKSAKVKIKQFFSAKKIAVMAVFTALAFVVSLFDFPLFPQASFLKLDFGNIFIMLTGFLFGPIEAVIVCVIKELIHIPVGTTGGVGELANILMAVSFVIIPSTVYRFKRKFWVVIPSLVAGVILQTCSALVCNRYITFPLFMGKGAESAFNSFWPIIIYFNLAKGAIISVACCLLYKTVSRLIKRL